MNDHDSGGGDTGVSEGGADGPTSEASADAGVFNPALYGNLELWVAADVGISTSSGKLTWTDQSPESHLVQSPNDSAPCTNPSVKSAAINGLPAVKFEGVSDCFTVSAGFADFSNGLSAFVVAQPQNDGSPFLGADSAFFEIGASATEQMDEITFGRNSAITNTATGDFELQIFNGTSGPATTVSTGSGDTYTNAVTHLFEVVVPATPGDQPVTGAKLYLDGAAVGTGTNDLAGAESMLRNTNFIGYNFYETANAYHDYAGIIGEIIVFSRGLTDNQRTAVEAHLKSKWGL